MLGDSGIVVVADDVCLIQFAKRPIEGFVKTRLIPGLGAKTALDVHKRLVKRTLHVLQTSETGTVQLWWDQCWDSQSFLADIEVKPAQYEQQGKDLGERMEYAIESALSTFNKVLLVGSDCPVLDYTYLQSALSLLDQYDVVLGPSDDGGYVLIGAQRFSKCTLQGIEWGTSTVLADTVNSFKYFGLSHAQLPPLYDVDEVKDFNRWQSEEEF